MSTAFVAKLRVLRRRWLPSWLLAIPILLAAALGAFSWFLKPPLFPKNHGLFDMRYYHVPHAYLLDLSLDNGELPLWNPLINCGTPFAANPQTAMFYPPHLLRALLVPTPTPAATSASIHIELLLHIVFAGLGAFLLARAYRLTLAARFTAAFTYMLGPFFVANALEFWHLISVASWLPWLLLCARCALETPSLRRRAFYGTLGGLAFGMSVLAGFPQLNFYTAVTLVLFCLLDRLFTFGRGMEDAGRFRLLAAVGRLGRSLVTHAGLVLCMLFVLGALVAAAALLPVAEMAPLSARVRSSGLAAMSWSQDLSPKMLLTSLAVYSGATPAATQGIRAAGIAALLLAVAALFHEQRRAVGVFGLLFLLLMDCSLGPPLPFATLMWRLDYFNFGSPWRVGLLCSLPFALLAAFGMDAVGRPIHSSVGRRMRLGLLLLVGAAALLALWRWQSHGPYLEIPAYAIYLPAVSMVVILCAGLLPWSAVWRTMIAVLLLGEIIAWDLHFVPYYAGGRTWGIAPPGLGDARALAAGNERGVSHRPNFDMLYLRPVINGYDPLYLNRVRQVLCAPRKEKIVFTSFRGDEVLLENPHGTLLYKRNFWLASQYVDGPLPPKQRPFPVASTVFLDNPGDLPVPRVEAESLPPSGVSKSAERIRLADATTLSDRQKSETTNTMSLRLPPIATGGLHSVLSLSYVSTSHARLDCLITNMMSSRTTKGAQQSITPTRQTQGYVEIPLPDADSLIVTLQWNARPGAAVFTEASVLRETQDEDHLIAIRSRTANTVDLDIGPLPGSRILTFLDAYYPGWKAWVDGEPVPVLKADDAFKAVVVPEGKHEVRFAYRPWRVYLGIAISVVCTLLIAVLLYVLRPGPYTSSAPPTSQD